VERTRLHPCLQNRARREGLRGRRSELSETCEACVTKSLNACCSTSIPADRALRPTGHVCSIDCLREGKQLAWSETSHIMSYCDYIRSARAQEPHISYHDTEYGFPSDDDTVLFERLVLEINQAGLSWETILKKRAGFRAAYDGFDIQKIARYTDEDVARLLADPGIIRNRLKVAAAIHNAKVVQCLQGEFGSFWLWLESNHPMEKADWVRLFKRTFKFTGGEAFLGQAIFLFSGSVTEINGVRLA